jgi:hypothetical protein
MSTNYATNLVEVLTERSDDLAKAGDPATVNTILSAAQNEAQQRTAPVYLGDTWVYRITVAVLGVAVLGSAWAQFGLANHASGPRAIPDGLIAIGSAAIGALAGLLAPTSTPASNGASAAKG